MVNGTNRRISFSMYKGSFIVLTVLFVLLIALLIALSIHYDKTKSDEAFSKAPQYEEAACEPAEEWSSNICEPVHEYRAEITPTTSELMKMLPTGISAPKSSSMLSSPQKKFVMTVYGNYLYIHDEPNKDSKEIDKAYEQSIVTIFAIQNGFALGIIEATGQGGWFKLNLLSDSYYPGPNPSDTMNLDAEIQRPVREDYIACYELKYVKTEHGVRAFLLKNPSDTIEHDKNFLSYVYESDLVTVLARHGSFSFVLTEDGTRAWMRTKLLVSNY